MKRGIVFFALFLAFTFLIALVVQQSTQAQRQDRPGGGAARGPRGSFMIGRSLNLESSWAHLCFEMKIADEVMGKARGVYKEAWDKRAKLMKGLEDAGDDQNAMNAATSDAEKIKADMLAKLKDVLSSEEMKKLAEWEESQQQQRQSMRTPPGPPGM